MKDRRAFLSVLRNNFIAVLILYLLFGSALALYCDLLLLPLCSSVTLVMCALLAASMCSF
jgi:hypothetical protein